MARTLILIIAALSFGCASGPTTHVQSSNDVAMQESDLELLDREIQQRQKIEKVCVSGESCDTNRIEEVMRVCTDSNSECDEQLLLQRS